MAFDDDSRGHQAPGKQKRLTVSVRECSCSLCSHFFRENIRRMPSDAASPALFKDLATISKAAEIIKKKESRKEKQNCNSRRRGKKGDCKTEKGETEERTLPDQPDHYRRNSRSEEEQRQAEEGHSGYK